MGRRIARLIPTHPPGERPLFARIYIPHSLGAHMKSVYVIGDSISIQYGPFLERDLRGFMGYSRKEGIEKAYEDLDVAQGANGGDSSMVLAFLQSMERDGGIDADVLLLNCGLHDIKSDPETRVNQVPLERYRTNLEEIVPLVGGMEPELVWVRTTPCDEKVHNRPGRKFFRFSGDCKAYNRVADEVMSGRGVPIVDLCNFTLNLGQDLYKDHVHYPKHVCEQQAAFISGWLIARYC